MLSFRTRNEIPGLTLHTVSPDTTAGAGSIAATGASTLTWTAPGSATAGAVVTIANGEAKILRDGADTDDFILVERTSATALSGTEIVIVTTGVSTSERLAQVDDAITKVLKAQSEGFGGDSLERANLAELRAYRNELAQLLAMEEGTRANVIQADMGGMMP